jgi:hypothetical protein
MIHLSNQLEQIDPPMNFGPCQTFEEAMERGRPAPEVSIFEKDKPQLSAEARAILANSAPELDPTREFYFNMACGDFGKAFAAPRSSALRKRKDAEAFEKADGILRDFQNNHDKKSLSEQLAPLCERACEKLSKENADRLRRALAALDLSIVTFFLGEAFA